MKPLDLTRMAGCQSGNGLAIFDMLMVLLGPLIGQSSGWIERQKAAEHPCMPMQPAEHGHSGAHLHHLLDACGYCSLFFHTPGIP